MRINNYKDLVEYKQRLKAKEGVSLNVLNYQWEEKQALWKDLIKKTLIPIGVATTGFAINSALSKWTSDDERDESAGISQGSAGRNTNESYSNAQLVVDLLKIGAPLISAYFTKKIAEDN